MNFDEYQRKAKSMAIYPAQYQIIYPALGIAGETGEVAELVKKWIRDERSHKMSDERRERIVKELGDILWYVSNLASDLNISLDAVASTNILKLEDRQARNVLQGDGDER